MVQNNTELNKNKENKRPSASLDWRQKGELSPDPNFNSFVRSKQRDSRVRKSALMPTSNANSQKYTPPHMRARASKPDALASTPSPKNNTKQRQRILKGPQTHILKGPLWLNAVEIFEKAHGLNGRAQVDYCSLQKEITSKYNCSEKAFQSLVLGRSYDDVLGPLRELVVGYLSKEELKKETKKKTKSKSCESSPTVLSPTPTNHTPFLMLHEPEDCPPLKTTSSPAEYFPQHGRRRLFSEPKFEREKLSPASVLATNDSAVPSDIPRTKVLSSYFSSNISDSDTMCKTCVPFTSQTALLTAAAIPLLFAAITSL